MAEKAPTGTIQACSRGHRVLLGRPPGEVAREERCLQETGRPLCEGIEERVTAFIHPPIEVDRPYPQGDATDARVKQAGCDASAAVFVAIGVNTDGRREVLGMDLRRSDGETFRTAILRKLARRGPQGGKQVIPDCHEGIKAAVSKVLPATRQWCRVHSCPTGSPAPAAGAPGRAGLHRHRRRQRSDAGSGRQPWFRADNRIQVTVQKPAALRDDAEPDGLADRGFPARHRAKPHPTSPRERLDGEIQAQGGGLRGLPERDGDHRARGRHPPAAER